MNFNQVVMAGRLCADPELTYTTNGKALCSFKLAVDNGYGEKKNTLFIQCVIFDKKAEVVAKYVTKGQVLLVTGSLNEREWTDENNQKRSYMQIKVWDFQFGSKSNTAGNTHYNTEDKAALPEIE